MKIPTAVMALMMLLAGLLTAAPASADPSPTATIMWPETTRLNPALATYDITVTDTGGRNLFYAWAVEGRGSYGQPRTPVPESGRLVLPPDIEGFGYFEIWSCSTEQWTDDCVVVRDSPRLEFRSRVTVGANDLDHQMIDDSSPAEIAGGAHTVEVGWTPQLMAGDVASASWKLLDAHRQPLTTPVTGTVASGGLDMTEYGASIPFTVPTDITSGHYFLDVQVDLQTTDFGSITGALSANGRLVELALDNDAPQLTVGAVAPRLYPVHDDYLDRVILRAKTDHEAYIGLEVYDASGVRIHRGMSYHSDANVWQSIGLVWAGKKGGKLVPEGRYTLKLTAEDWVGNTDTWTGRITVSHKKLEWRDFKRTVTARASRTGKPFVGRCSTLSSPAHGGPRGSLGFYSRTRCTGDGDAGAVATNHGMYLPKAVDNRYGWARVTLNGGPATRSNDNYIVLGYLDSGGGRMYEATVLGRGNGAHRGSKLDLTLSGVWDRETSKPYIVWSNGLTAGSRYDVRSYTVQVRYRVLR